MAMYGFGTTLFLYSLYNLHVAGVQTPNAIVSVAICFGGFTQVLAGLWEFVSGNTVRRRDCLEVQDQGR
jgi:succinate-acetate transporter protein